MSSRAKSKTKVSEEDIDGFATAQADNDSAWEKPVHVRQSRRASLSLPDNSAARASFLARLRRNASAEQWLTHIIQERIELEEAAFSGAKHDLAGRPWEEIAGLAGECYSDTGGVFGGERRGRKLP